MNRLLPLLLAGCFVALSAEAQAEPQAAKAATQAVDVGMAWLIGHQDKDGAWRSDTYGSLRGGPSLTPFIAETLDEKTSAGAAVRLAEKYLLGLKDDVLERLPLPVYTAAPAYLLTQDKRYLEMLRSRHFNRANGFAPDRTEFGAWGYTSRPLGGPGRLTFARKHDTNISATLIALQALPADADTHSGAAAFAKRCQNQETGGFFFSPTDLTRNKAGDRRAYGSATADGLRLYLAAGRDLSDPGVRSARDWLVRHFKAELHPGDFEPGRESLRNSYFYYYTASIAEAFQELEQRGDRIKLDWRTPLRAELVKRQAKNGSWANTFTDAKEDDPLVATSLAIRALHAME